MTEKPTWLPPLVLLSDYEGDWNRYLSVLYSSFESDFLRTRPHFQGQRLGLKRHPLWEGKEATFWHMISEGRDEATRQPDLRRCERIRWPRAVIENSNDPAVKVWQTTRRNERRICLWLEKEEYLVVLAERRGYLLPWTAYMVTRSHRKLNLQKEFDRWKKKEDQYS